MPDSVESEEREFSVGWSGIVIAKSPQEAAIIAADMLALRETSCSIFEVWGDGQHWAIDTESDAQIVSGPHPYVERADGKLPMPY